MHSSTHQVRMREEFQASVQRRSVCESLSAWAIASCMRLKMRRILEQVAEPERAAVRLALLRWRITWAALRRLAATARRVKAARALWAVCRLVS